MTKFKVGPRRGFGRGVHGGPIEKFFSPGSKFTKLLSCLQAKNIANKTEKWLIAKYSVNFKKKISTF